MEALLTLARISGSYWETASNPLDFWKTRLNRPDSENHARGCEQVFGKRVRLGAKRIGSEN